MSVRMQLTTGPIPHPPFGYPSMEAAREDVQKALESGVYVREDPDVAMPGTNNILLFQLGAGSVMHIATDRVYRDIIASKQMEMQRTSSGLIIPAPAEPAKDFKLIIQSGVVQLDPLDYTTREEAQSAVREGLKRGWIEYVCGPEEERYIQTGPGTLFMVISTKNYEMQRRNAMAHAQQQRQQNFPQMPPGVKRPGRA